MFVVRARSRVEINAREIVASARVVLAAVGRGINSGLQSSPRPVSVVRSSGAVRQVEPTPLRLLCVTPGAPLVALVCRIPRTDTGAWLVRVPVQCGVSGGRVNH